MRKSSNRDDPFMEDFAGLMFKLRAKKGVSARDMSLSLGQNHNYINRIENGKNYPAMLVFFYICDYFEITPKIFFDYEHDITPQHTEMFNELLKLDTDAQNYIMKLVKLMNEKP